MERNKNKEKEAAFFAAGCFWHIEDSFSKIPGIVETKVGYMGGKMKNPSYALVCSTETGHVETTKVVFDKRKISYRELLDVFWKIHDPTTKDRQGADVGSQYNSVIFYVNKEQKNEAEKSKKELQKKINRRILTPIRKAKKFWPAEEYHQKYTEKHRKVF